MNWLNDKKNQPIVVGALVGIIAIVLVIILVLPNLNSGGGSPSATPPPPMPQTGPSGAAPTAPVEPSAPAPRQEQPAARPAANDQVALAGPMETWRKDPFLPIGYKPPKKPKKVMPIIYDLPIPDLARYNRAAERVKETTIPEPPQPSRRMAGLLLSDRVYAILETNGKTEIVQPGDTLGDGLAKVDRIEPDQVILKTLNPGHPRAPSRPLVVKMTSASQVEKQARAGAAAVPGPPLGVRNPMLGGPPVYRGQGM